MQELEAPGKCAKGRECTYRYKRSASAHAASEAQAEAPKPAAKAAAQKLGKRSLRTAKSKLKEATAYVATL